MRSIEANSEMLGRGILVYALVSQYQYNTWQRSFFVDPAQLTGMSLVNNTNTHMAKTKENLWNLAS